MPRARLSDEEVRQLRLEYAAGRSQQDLAEEYGVAQNTVSSLVTGRVRESAGGPISRGSGRKLSPEDVARIRHAVAAGEARGDVAREYGVTVQSVANIVTGASHRDVPGPLQGKTRSPARPLTREQVQEIKTRVETGENRMSIAAEFGVSPITVDSILWRNAAGVDGGLRDSLSREDVLQIRRLYESGETQRDLASSYGLTQQMISNVVRGIMYSSYGGPISASKRKARTAADVARIRRAHEAGADKDRLAAQYGTTREIIREVIRGVTYPNISSQPMAIEEDVIDGGEDD